MSIKYFGIEYLLGNIMDGVEQILDGNGYDLRVIPYKSSSICANSSSDSSESENCVKSSRCCVTNIFDNSILKNKFYKG
jgi:hypothetical protein